MLLRVGDGTVDILWNCSILCSIWFAWIVVGVLKWVVEKLPRLKSRGTMLEMLEVPGNTECCRTNASLSCNQPSCT
jgi:hypothetical protein